MIKRDSTINNSNLGYSYTWNSGTYIACKLIATGVSTTVVILSEGNTRLGLLTDKLVSWGCKTLIENVETNSGSGGGDSGASPGHDPAGAGGPNPPGSPPKTGIVTVLPGSAPIDPFHKPGELLVQSELNNDKSADLLLTSTLIDYNSAEPTIHFSPIDHTPPILVGLPEASF